MAGYINSIRKGISKLAKGADEAAPEPKPKVDAEDEGPTPVPLEPSPLDPEKSSFNIPRAGEVLEGTTADPRPNIMEMGRPDDGNLNLRQLGDDPELRQIADLVNEKQNRFQESPARQVVTHEETVRKSQDLKVLRHAINKDFDVGYNPEEVVALGRLNKQVTVRLKDEARRILDDAQSFKNVSDDELAAFAEIENLAVTAQQLITDAAAMSGRTLNAFNIIKNLSSGKRYDAAVSEIIDLSGGRLSIEQRMRAYGEGKTVADVQKIISESWIDKSWKWALSIRYNAMLSGPSTHLANMIGSATSTIWENTLIRPMSMMYSQGERGLRAVSERLGSDTFKPLDIEEVIDLQEGFGGLKSVASGFIHGFDAFMNRMFTLRDDSFGGDAAALIGRSHQVELMSDLPKLGESRLGRAVKHIPTPVKALTAEDAFFKGLNYQMELPRAVWRNLKKDFDDPKKIKEEFDKLMDPNDLDNRINPEVMREAREFAELVTFTNQPDMYSKFLGNVVMSLMEMRNKSNFWKVIIPFARTPANLMIYAKNNMLLNPRIIREWTTDPKKRAEWNARATASMGLFAVVKSVYDSGNLTGAGNPDKALRELEQKTGYAPSNAFQVDGLWYQLQRADPFGLIIGLMATAIEYSDSAAEGDVGWHDAILGALLESMSLTLDRSMLQSVSDLVSLSQGTLGAARAGDLAGLLAIVPTAMQPGIARSFRKIEDPYHRTMVTEGLTWNGLGDRIRKRVMNTWASTSVLLPPGRDWRGEIKSYHGNNYVRALLPFNVIKPMDDKATAAIVQYGVGFSRVGPKVQLPKSSWSINLLDFDDHGWIHNEYERQVGVKRNEYLSILTDSKFFADLTKDIIKDGVVMDAPKYEAVQSKMQNIMSRAKQDATKGFLVWLDGRTEMKGRVLDDNNNREDIQFNEVFNISDYIDLEVKFQKGETLEDIKSSIFKKTGRTLTRPAQEILESVTNPPAEQTIEF